ncbi:hypothetical protein ZIOFF_027959 [Zingiber officinale]|uniref:Uncharacterized protein n=1 Tax=Zingiber officinale TaxID=94328 RepID=A0A8J5L9I7_ZINOF|nr:hypothetical protein ZIOFF_027959 [Zingiber officinale]
MDIIVHGATCNLFFINCLTRGYEAWQNSEANLLITRGLVGRLSNTPNVGFAYEVQGMVDYLTSHGVNALPGRSLSTRHLQGLNWVINPTQMSIPMQPYEVNSQTKMDGRISLSFNNYVVAQPIEQPVYNNKDDEVQEILAHKDYEDYDDKGKQVTDNETRNSSQTDPHILVNKISQHVVLPQRQMTGSAGLDIAACHTVIIEPNGRELVHTRLRIESDWPPALVWHGTTE